MINTARVFSPKPSPSQMPAAMAITFFVAPAISQPTTSVPMYTRNVRVCTRSWTRRGQHLVRQGHHTGGRLPLGHLPGQIRAGQDPGGDAGKDLR